ncbi:arabinan endo-1,5-alpha-L-arabinosidase [Gracilibacillus orientalis]|uniref:Arabinan endo-1,5-alpha-L-arabinosidase n=1 Tax=Gracilibacillus orientalis TaxID=334253 RepID=A0A1I4K2U6_9BACI|nr:LamG-like jellyroll fold domain-containing protein [Gracilibacillus orientalis]SFL73068.1 arabinan endo-1,5-alpha-L-arabinosidase [Gracilibacillus orientalis]
MISFVKRISMVGLLLMLFIPTTVFGDEENDTESKDFDRASVHDPSIIKGDDGTYYVFGSHIAVAKSNDLSNWNSIVDREYQTPENNPIYGDLSSNLAESFEWAGEDDADSSGGFAVWAPDIFWNKDYVWKDGSTGAYMLYYSVSSTYIRSGIGIAVSKDMEGPYEYTDTIMYSGFTNYESYDDNSDVNKHWENTNLSELIDEGIIDEVNPDYFTEDGDFNNALYTNAIDANILYDENGDLYMTYGSWSGGTFILELDKETGTPIYPGEDGETSDGRMIDRYFGTKIAGGYGRSGEGTYAVYDEETGYYYLYITYGGLASDGGYQMRQFRSESIDGPYVDAAGNEAVFPESFDIGVGNFPGNDDHKEIGNKMMGNFQFKRDFGEEGSGIGTGYMAPGHNSYLIDEDLGKEFIVTHTRFPQEGEMHEVRVHQTFKNSDQWPVPTPYHYADEEIEAVSESDVVGDYKYLNHGKEITGELTESTWVKLNEDHTVTGAVTGTWELYDDYRVELTVDDATYDGVFIRQYDPTSEEWVMTFSAMSNQGVVVWGSHVESKGEQEVVDGIKQELSESLSERAISDLNLPTLATQGTEITWESSQPEVISSEGAVNRPAFGSDDANVDLTATISLGEVTETLTVTITVPVKGEAGVSAYYDFSDGLSDNSGKQEDATVTGDRIHNTGGEITFADGIEGQAAKFDGESGLKLADGLISSDQYSISLWMKPEEITEFTTTFFGARTENNWISLVPNAENVTKVWAHNGDDWYDAVSDSIIPAGEWTHFAFTVNEGEAKVYINGEEKFSDANFPDIFTTVDAQFSLGVNFWDTPFKGLMDEVRVYDGVALPVEEVQDLYENLEGEESSDNEEENGEDGSSEEDGQETEDKVISKVDDLEKVNNVYQTNVDMKKTIIKKEVVDQLDETAFIALQMDHVQVKIPVSILKGKEDIVFELGEVSETIKSKYANAVSDLYDFTLTSGDKEISFDSPVTLTFNVDAEKVTNWDNLRVVYMDENGELQEEIIPESVEDSTAEVIAEVSHFSIYGVVEVADDTNGDGPTGDGTGSEDPSGTEGGSEDDGSTDNGSETGDDSSAGNDEQTEGDGETLPDTATNQYNWLALGLLLIAVGLGVFLTVRGRKNTAN